MLQASGELGWAGLGWAREEGRSKSEVPPVKASLDWGICVGPSHSPHTPPNKWPSAQAPTQCVSLGHRRNKGLCADNGPLHVDARPRPGTIADS